MTAPDVRSLRQSELLDRLVLDIDTTEELGRVVQFRVDAATQQVEGFVCRRGTLGLNNHPILWVQVESIGNDSILVRRQGTVPTTRFDAAFSLEKLEVWSDAGNNVGQLVDFYIDLQTGNITQYLFSAPGLKRFKEGIYTLQPEAVVSLGQKRLLVKQAALDTAPQFVPGVPDRLTKAFQRDLNQTRQDWQGALEGTREIAGQVQQQTQKLAEQAKSLLGQVKQRTKQLRQEVNERVADAAATLQTPSREEPPAETLPDLDEGWTEDENAPQAPNTDER